MSRNVNQLSKDLLFVKCNKFVSVNFAATVSCGNLAEIEESWNETFISFSQITLSNRMGLYKNAITITPISLNVQQLCRSFQRTSWRWINVKWTLFQRCMPNRNVDSTSWRWIYVESTLFQRCVPAGIKIQHIQNRVCFTILWSSSWCLTLYIFFFTIKSSELRSRLYFWIRPNKKTHRFKYTCFCFRQQVEL